MQLLASVTASIIATLTATLITNIIFYLLGGFSFTYRFVNLIKSNKKIVFVFEKHETICLKWKNYYKIFKIDGYKIIRIKNNNEQTWQILNKYLKRANDVSVAGFAKVEYATYIGLLSSKKQTTVYYRTQNTEITRMVFTGEEFNFKNKLNFSKTQNPILIKQNKKRSQNKKLNEGINIWGGSEHPNALEYIFEIKSLAKKIAKQKKNIKIEFIGKAIFAFAFAQVFFIWNSWNEYKKLRY